MNYIGAYNSLEAQSYPNDFNQIKLNGQRYFQYIRSNNNFMNSGEFTVNNNIIKKLVGNERRAFNL